MFFALDHGHGLVGAAWAIVLASGLQWALTTGWVMTRLHVRILDLGKSLAAGAALGILTTTTMLLLSLDWWLESTIAAALGATLLLMIPQWVVPTWTDPQVPCAETLASGCPLSCILGGWIEQKSSLAR